MAPLSEEFWVTHPPWQPLPDSEDRRAQINAQVETYLANGGTIQQIPPGVSALEKPTKRNRADSIDHFKHNHAAYTPRGRRLASDW